MLGQDAFVSALVKAFRRPFVLGTADDTAHARSVMLLCGPNGTGRHYALQCVVDELAARGVLHSAAVETLDLALYPGPAQEKLFFRTYAALQSAAEVLTFEHYEAVAANYLNMLATLAMDGTLALSSRYVFAARHPRGCRHGAGPGAIGELQAGGKYFVFYSNKGETALADHFGAKFVDAVAGDICRTEAFHPRGAGRRGRAGAELSGPATRRQCGLALTMGADVRDLLASQYGKTSGMQAMRDYCETVYRSDCRRAGCRRDAHRRHARRADGGERQAVHGRERRDLTCALAPAVPRRTRWRLRWTASSVWMKLRVMRDIAKNVCGPAAPQGPGPEGRRGQHAHDLYRKPRHRQDDDCPHTGQVPEGHRRTARAASSWRSPAPIWWAAMSATRPR